MPLFCLMSTLAVAQKTKEESASQQPDVKRWEVGVGLGGLTAPDYKGSKTYHEYIAPLPYVVYRGPVIRTDRDGVRGDFLRTDSIELNASMALSITPDSDKNALRLGMPELLSTLEVGPAVNINLTGEHFSDGLSLSIPLRAVFTVGDGSPDYIGITSTPSLIYRLDHGDGWRWTLRAGPVLASGKYHDYYYSVKPEYVTPERPEFNARSGYNGFNGQVSLSRRFSDYWYAFYFRYSNIQGADFVDSPLVETEHNAVAGFAVSWVFL
ncbi:MipA/OmpV family protein [Gilvimarinus agarilyticus]|nr:MipA/OmpV family protein [Gilvimarinus agarilyticus]